MDRGVGFTIEPGHVRHMPDSVFANKEALSSDYQPEKVVGREEQIESLSNILRWCANESHEDALLNAHRGYGAATITSYLLEHLRNVLSERGEDLTVSWVDCVNLQTSRRVAVQLVDQLPGDVPTGGRSCYEIMNKAVRVMERTSGPIVVVLEWPDHVEDYSHLYDILTRANEPHHDYPQLSTITITPNLQFGDAFDSGTESRFYPHRIPFHPYGPDQLRKIIETRCEVAFAPSTVTEKAVEKCAQLIGKTSGSANRALITLRLAGDRAIEDGSKTVLQDHIVSVYEQLDTIRLIDKIKKLDCDSRLVLLALAQLTKEGSPQVSTSQLYDKYTKMAKKMDYIPLSQRRMRDRLHTLFDEILIELTVTNKGRAGGRHYDAKLHADEELAIDEIRKHL